MTQLQQAATKLRPLGGRVLLRRLEREEQVGGIFLPDTAKKKQELAEVIAVGPGEKNKQGQIISMNVQVGDVVLLEKYSGQEVTLEDQEYIIAKASDLIAVVEKNCSHCSCN